jgi:hypothetical protein
MFKFLLTIFLVGVAVGVYIFASDSAKADAKSAGIALVQDAADAATDAAMDKAEDAGKAVVSRVKDILTASKEKLMKK